MRAHFRRGWGLKNGCRPSGGADFFWNSPNSPLAQCYLVNNIRIRRVTHAFQAPHTLTTADQTHSCGPSRNCLNYPTNTARLLVVPWPNVVCACALYLLMVKVQNLPSFCFNPLTTNTYTHGLWIQHSPQTECMYTGYTFTLIYPFSCPRNSRV